MPINLPNGNDVEEIVLPNGANASEVYGPNGKLVWVGTTIPDSAISQWKFDEGAGTVVADSVGNNDGEVKGPTWVSNNWLGGSALDGDGVDDWVDIPNISGGLATLGSNRDLNLAVGFTFETTSNQHAFYGFSENESGGGLGLSAGLGQWPGSTTDGGNIHCEVCDEDFDRIGVKTDASFNDGDKHRVLFNKKGNTASDLEIHIDGVERAVSVVNDHDAFPGTIGDFQSAALFARNDGSQHIDSILDNLAIFNDSLTGEEITDDYQRQPWS